MTNQDRVPVESIADIQSMDMRDMLNGYLAGLRGRDEPGVEFNRDYWHGWRNGMVDGGHRKNPDSHQAKLAEEYLKNLALRG